MPPASDDRLKSSLAYIGVASRLFNDAAGASESELLETLGRTVGALVVAAQNIRQHNQQCSDLLEDVQCILGSLISIYHVGIDPTATESEQTKQNLKIFLETLHKLYAYLSAQQAAQGFFRQIFRQSEIAQLLDGCQKGLQHAKLLFNIDQAAQNLFDLENLHRVAEQHHKELLTAVEAMSESDTTTSGTSGLRTLANASCESFAMPPPMPKIFHGRDSELEDIVQSMLGSIPTRIAILGPGGIGKTTLAKAVLHDPRVVSTHSQQLFVPCHTASDATDLAGQIASSLGIKIGRYPTQAVLHQLSNARPTLLVLDNIDLAWESEATRAGVEDLLSRLSEIVHLTLLVTLRGTEHPKGVRWTRPFLPPLAPVSDEAALEILVGITDLAHNLGSVQKVLALTDNVPLAIELMAHAIEFEDIEELLDRWEQERTDILRNDADGGNALEISIGVSLASPRLVADPGALELLQLLSVLPDGLADNELLDADLGIPNILRSKSTLTRVSLAYFSHDNRVKLLIPVREFLRHRQSPLPQLCFSMLSYFVDILKSYNAHLGRAMKSTVVKLNTNTQNIRTLIGWCCGINKSEGQAHKCIECALLLSKFKQHITGIGDGQLLREIVILLDDHPSQTLNLMYASGRVFCFDTEPALLDELILRGTIAIAQGSDLKAAAVFYRSIAMCAQVAGDGERAMSFARLALDAAQRSGSASDQCSSLDRLSMLQTHLGHYHSAQEHSLEALRISQLNGDHWAEARSCLQLSTLTTRFGDYPEAAKLARRGMELLDICGLQSSTVYRDLIAIIAEVHFLRTEYINALAMHQHNLAHISGDNQMLNNYNRIWVLLNMVQVGMLLGTGEAEIGAMLSECTVISTRQGYNVLLPFCTAFRAALELREGRFGTAAAGFQLCLRDNWGQSHEAVMFCLEHLADSVLWPEHAAHIAWTSAVTFLAKSHKAGDRLEKHKALRFLAALEACPSMALALLQVALDGFKAMGVHQHQAECLVQIAELRSVGGEIALAEAVGMWEEAIPLLKRSSQLKRVAEVQAKINAAEVVAVAKPERVPATAA
ncbi:hypothetical protein MKEN_00484100 [Mycena kentingensis (nom. inval.)]|nr:hypothetical protein MKEN_00484100 [Mycena kentingensis (nom. inval.)]